MKSLRQYLISLLLCITGLTFASSLNGRVKNANELSLYYISNFLTGEKTIVSQCKVDSVGDYRFDFSCDSIRTYYVDLGSRMAQIVIMPNQTITLDLPNNTPLQASEYLNPYFEKNIILAYNEAQKDINYDLMNIEKTNAQQLKRVLESQSPGYTAQTAIDSLRKVPLYNQNYFTNDYLRYSEALFYHLSNPEKTQAIKQHYLRDAIPDLQNTAFVKLFSSEYSNPFIAPDGLFYQVVSDAIINNKISDKFINDIGKIHKIKNTKMAELIAVKGFYDAALYAPKYQRDITQLMTQLESLLQNPEIKKLCHSTRLKLERLMVGSPAPYYELYTVKGKKVPTVLNRRNVLLAFVNTNIFECQKQLRLLEKYKATYKRQLEIVVVAVYQDKKELERFLSRNKYNNLYFTLWQNSSQLLEDYNIKTLPTYYLIDKKGNIVYAPLSSPEENMQIELQQALE